ncbi:MAG: hypothetical protein AABX85_02590 [Nanoarchaeota archaeon]
MEKIQANMVLEILGRPKENVSIALGTILDSLSKEKGTAIKEKILHEPIPVEGSKDLFTAFTELAVEFDSLSDYYQIMFAYMPSNVEIVYPEKIIVKNDELTSIGNKLIQRLHDYDAVVKNTLMEKEILVKKLYEIAPHLFKKNPNQLQEKQQDSSEQQHVSGQPKDDKESKKTKKEKKKQN